MYKSRTRGHADHPLFRFSEKQMEDLLKAYGYNSEAEFDKTIDMVKEWVMHQSHFVTKDIDRNYIEAMFIGAKGSMERTKKLLDRRCTLTNLMPDLFTNIDTDTFDRLLASYKHVLLPASTDDFYRILIGKFSKHNIHKYTIKDLTRYYVMCSEYHMMNDVVFGHIAILDLTDVSMTDFFATWNTVEVQKLMTILLEGYATKIQSIHLLTNSKFIDTLVSLLKQVLSEKLGRRIQTHTSHESLLNFLPKKLLPRDYGGSQKSIEELHDVLYTEMKNETHRRHMKMIESYRTDESKRQSLEFNEAYMGMPGSFRTLTVD